MVHGHEVKPTTCVDCEGPAGITLVCDDCWAVLMANTGDDAGKALAAAEAMGMKKWPERQWRAKKSSAKRIEGVF